MPEPVALITGASSGIGAELARVFARHGHRLVLAARRTERLELLADQLASNAAARPLVLTVDLLKPDAGDVIQSALEREALEPQFVINNAGFGLAGLAALQPRERQLDMIDLNVRALTDLSLRFVGTMERHRGGLMNVASVAGFLPGPKHAVYYATKAYVVSFTEALHEEWRSRGIRVTTLCPGPVPTEFQAVAGTGNAVVETPMTTFADRVALDAYRGLIAGKRLVVPGFLNKLLVYGIGLVPHAALLPQVAKRHGPGTNGAPPGR
ncbi:SDR family oxidoreductase [Pseudorhodoplanes sp.]|uniref:SDR family NAD(P)-dependent oxidoreductase n=1 Tax=Pseudorhodoplanes sp. TaxID=1934341 RepID=UPI002C6DDEE8|nr:SDR family oxidoreductase [Pseudorhodoplanes sp.]HWV53006.1 SDR family oxidoreductase [Pseudorhodoplanes sp.]